MGFSSADSGVNQAQMTRSDSLLAVNLRLFLLGCLGEGIPSLPRTWFRSGWLDRVRVSLDSLLRTADLNTPRRGHPPRLSSLCNLPLTLLTPRFCLQFYTQDKTRWSLQAPRKRQRSSRSTMLASRPGQPLFWALLTRLERLRRQPSLPISTRKRFCAR